MTERLLCDYCNLTVYSLLPRIYGLFWVSRGSLLRFEVLPAEATKALACGNVGSDVMIESTEIVKVIKIG
jgi:hypothetical protein